MSDDMPYIVIAEDDEDDRVLLQAALQECDFSYPVDFVVDGEDLLAYLYREARHANRQDAPLPSLILLDLNMPRKNGHEALLAIRGDVNLKHIPVIVMTTSRQQEEVQRMYALGANSFISKPSTFEGLVRIFTLLETYWFRIVRLP